uniref:RNA-directed DNA polymerase n=1 Tax=Anopheles atroparvus TaxID=41427 RepID=A0AAG5DP56_ANOAO
MRWVCGHYPLRVFAATYKAQFQKPLDVQECFPKVFQGTGLCKKASIKCTIKDNCRPVFRPKRPAAYAMQEVVDKELQRLEELGVITPITHSEWAAPVVVVRKASGAVRICGDYSTGLNDALQPYDYPLPLPEDIFARLANCSVFSKLDLSDAFLQVEIDQQHRTLLTINTHRGLFSYNRLPPGLKIAPAAFQQVIDTMLAGLNNVFGYLDDIVIGGATTQEHNASLQEVLKRIAEYGFTIKPEKCAFNVERINYLGHIIDRRGLRPDSAKIEAILKLPEPTDVTGVRAFLGAVNYYGRFVKGMRELRYPLDCLLKGDKPFRWTEECRAAFEKFKAVLSSDLLLTHYDPRQEIIVSADASSIGLGATISHKYTDGSVRVVQHASRALSNTEQAYSQIDREALAIIYAITKFRKMIFGRRFVLQTDHKPLLRIFGSKKGIPTYTANRLQRFALTLLAYDFDIKYVRTEEFGGADILSRLIANHNKPEPECIIASIETDDDLAYVAVNALNVFPLSFNEVAEATQRDVSLRNVGKYIVNGWPKAVQYGSELASFYSRRECLSNVKGCILFGERVVIPRILQKRCLAQLHKGHPGIVRMKAIARSYVYWPNMDEDIVEAVATCVSCQSASKSPPKVESSAWPKPLGPWNRVHIDYAGPLDGVYFLVIVDAFSKWPEIVKTASTSAHATIAILRGIFARHGSPITLVSDNGPQFVGEHFEDFCKRFGIAHITTAPYHPQSNGQAERFVDTFKRALRKIQPFAVSTIV